MDNARVIKLAESLRLAGRPRCLWVERDVNLVLGFENSGVDIHLVACGQNTDIAVVPFAECTRELVELLKEVFSPVFPPSTPSTPSTPSFQPQTSTPKRKKAVSSSSDWEEAAEQCQRILDMCEEVPERGEEFAASVMEKVNDIAAWIDQHEDVTEGQRRALENMEAGVARWMP